MFSQPVAKRKTMYQGITNHYIYIVVVVVICFVFLFNAFCKKLASCEPFPSWSTKSRINRFGDLFLYHVSCSQVSIYVNVYLSFVKYFLEGPERLTDRPLKRCKTLSIGFCGFSRNC